MLAMGSPVSASVSLPEIMAPRTNPPEDANVGVGVGMRVGVGAGVGICVGVGDKIGGGTGSDLVSGVEVGARAMVAGTGVCVG